MRPTDLAWLVLLAAALPGLIAYYHRLWLLPHYQFFPAAFAGAAWLALSVNSPASSAAPSRSRLVGLLLWSAIALLAVSVTLGTPWLTAVALIVGLAGRAYQGDGHSRLGAFVPALLMIATTIRIPWRLDYPLILRLQEVTSALSDKVLDIFGVVHVRSGNVIVVATRSLFVEEACSGINSLFSILACTLFYLLWTKAGPLRWVALFVAAPIWVVFANVFRVTATTVLVDRWHIPADSFPWHEILGFASFALAALLVYGTERLILFYSAVLPPSARSRTTTTQPVATASVATPELTSPRRRLPAAFAAAALLVLQLFVLIDYVRNAAPLAKLVPPTFDASFMPADQAGWTRSDFQVIRRGTANPFGETSQTWSYVGDSERVIVSLDYPFAGPHDLSECYVGQGWSLDSREIEPAAGAVPPIVVLHLSHRAAGKYAQVRYVQLRPTGEFVAPPESEAVDAWMARTWNRLQSRSVLNAGAETAAANYQIQLMLESYGSPTPAEQWLAREFFIRCFARLRPALIGGAAGPSPQTAAETLGR